MNTPKTPKRYKEREIKDPMPGGGYAPGITEPRMALAFAKAVTRFVQLENAMSRLLAVLLNDQDALTGGYVWRAIINAKTRADLMVHLLEASPHNQLLGLAYDNAISDYRRVAKARNELAHGYWKTHDSGTCYVTKQDQDGDYFNFAEPVTPEEVEAINDDILELTGRVHTLIMYTPPRPEVSAPPIWWI